MGKGDLPGLGVTSPADEGPAGDRMVRTAEGAMGDEGSIRRQLPRYTVDPGRFQRLLQAQWRQDTGQSLGQHRLPCSGRPDQNGVMASGCRDLQGPLDTFLPFDLTKVRVGKRR